MKTLALVTLLGLVACCPPQKGDKGSDGLVGLPGTPAAPSAPCTVVRGVGFATITCPDGTSTIIQDGAVGGIGGTGPKGDKGDQGDIGLPGSDGSPGTVVTVVNLCPGVTVYPSAFVETALCINNNLYGVYSANGGFLTYFPPGNYSSNAIGSACSLTIQANCVVSH